MTHCLGMCVFRDTDDNHISILRTYLGASLPFPGGLTPGPNSWRRSRQRGCYWSSLESVHKPHQSDSADSASGRTVGNWRIFQASSNLPENDASVCKLPGNQPCLLSCQVDWWACAPGDWRQHTLQTRNPGTHGRKGSKGSLLAQPAGRVYRQQTPETLHL